MENTPSTENPGVETKLIKLLLVEDEPADRLLIRTTLQETSRESFRFHEAETLGQALDLLKENSFDVVLLDLSLPDAQGIDTFTTAHAHASDTPIIVLSGLNDESLAVKAVNLGAQDYLVPRDRSLWTPRPIRKSEKGVNNSRTCSRNLISPAPGAGAYV